MGMQPPKNWGGGGEEERGKGAVLGTLRDAKTGGSFTVWHPVLIENLANSNE